MAKHFHVLAHFLFRNSFINFETYFLVSQSIDGLRRYKFQKSLSWKMKEILINSEKDHEFCKQV